MKLTVFTFAVLFFIASLSSCTMSAETAQLVETFKKSDFGPFIANLLEASPKTDEDIKVLQRALEAIRIALEQLKKEEDESYAAAVAAYDKFKTKLTDSLKKVNADITITSQRLYDDLIPQADELTAKLKSLAQAIKTTQGLIDQTDKDIKTYQDDLRIQETSINECIKAIDEAIGYLSTVKSQNPALIQTHRIHVNDLFKAIADKSSQIKASSYSHLLTTLTQVSMSNGAMQDGEGIAAVIALLNKIRAKLVSRLAEVQTNYKQMIKAAQDSRAGLVDLLGQYQKDQAVNQDALDKLTGEIKATKKSLEGFISMKNKWEKALTELEEQFKKAKEIHEAETKTMNKQIKLVKDTKTAIDEGKLGA